VKDWGFTLVELLVAILVLCGGVLCVVSGMALATRLVAFGGARDEAAAFAVGQLELWRGTRCDGQGVSRLPTRPDVTWTTVVVGNTVERATVVVGTTVAGRSRSDTFTVTGGC
jgi:hypothetical protein